MRPVPERARLIRLDQVLSGQRYDVAIAHNLSDLLALRSLDVPKVLVLHVNLAARVLEEPGSPPVSNMQRQLHEYLSAISAVAVAVSEAKARSWGQGCQVIRPCADPAEYHGFTGDEAVALRVANQVMQRPRRFAWDAHVRISEGHPLTLLGHNPEISGSAPANSWAELKAAYRQHRAYVHTAGVGLDDGYNLGVVEAMMTGMPVVSLQGSESPIVDGVNGHVGDDLFVLNAQLGALLADRSRARELGERARESALREFSVAAFSSGWHAALESARRARRGARA
jgi:glycosyltransferase involved in cell wall biosynthesis